MPLINRMPCGQHLKDALVCKHKFSWHHKNGRIPAHACTKLRQFENKGSSSAHAKRGVRGSLLTQKKCNLASPVLLSSLDQRTFLVLEQRLCQRKDGKSVNRLYCGTKASRRRCPRSKCQLLRSKNTSIEDLKASFAVMWFTITCCLNFASTQHFWGTKAPCAASVR